VKSEPVTIVFRSPPLSVATEAANVPGRYVIWYIKLQTLIVCFLSGSLSKKYLEASELIGARVVHIEALERVARENSRRINHRFLYTTNSGLEGVDNWSKVEGFSDEDIRQKMRLAGMEGEVENEDEEGEDKEVHSR